MKSHGTLLYVDLNNGEFDKQPISAEMRTKFVGGRGINTRLLFDEVGPGVDALSPENVLIFGTGLLSGTSAPCPARFNVTAKSPLTGILGDANAGGFFGPAMRRAGVEHIIIRGRAKEPVYLHINDDQIELRSAKNVWGKGSGDAEQAIRDELGDHRVRVATMGPAGENLSRIANVVHEERSASRTGMGAVMGSKNLKAVAVRGTKKVEGVHDVEGFNKLSKDLNKAIAEGNDYEHFTEGSASSGVYYSDFSGILAVKNFQSAGEMENIENFNPEEIPKKFYHGNLGCFGCPIRCGRYFEVKEGPYAGEKGQKLEEGAFGSFGPVVGNSNIESIMKMNNLSNHLGMDMMELGQAMAVLMELQQRNIITPDDLDGISMTWGDHEAMIKMMHKMAHREGIGDVLADGIVRAAPHFGEEALKYVSHAKGMVLSALDPRTIKGTALGLATSTRGADHLRSMVMPEFVPVMLPEEAEERFGSAEAIEAGSYNKASAAIWFQHLAMVPDLLEICRFLFHIAQGTDSFSFEDLTKLYSLATGIEADEDHMFKLAERVWNVERAFLVREGIRRKDDRLIGKWATEPVPNGENKGEILDPEKWEGMLDDYYRLRGWTDQGVPTKEKLTDMGLEDIAANLESAGVYSK